MADKITIEDVLRRAANVVNSLPAWMFRVEEVCKQHYLENERKAKEYRGEGDGR